MKRKEKYALVPLLVFVLGTAGCGRDSIAPAAVVPVPPEILAAPTQIAIGSTTLRLTTYLWRDFQPGASTDATLLARLQLQADAGSAIPSGLKVDKAWVVLDSQAWVTAPRQEGPLPNTSTLVVISRGGPAWGVGALVTVVAQVRDGGNNSYLLRAAPQKIVGAD